MARSSHHPSLRREPPGVASGAKVPASSWICDVNGVLIDSRAVIADAFSATAVRYGFPCDERRVRAISGLWLLEAYRRLDPGGDPWSRRAYHLAFVLERAAELHAFAGVRETLAAAKAAGMRIGAVTSHGEIAEAALVHSGLYALIDCLVTQEEVKHPKPHPDAVLRAMRLLDDDLHHRGLDAMIVGDTAEDIEAGRAAGISTVGATYGMSREAEIRSAEPDYVIHSFDEMRSWIVCGETEGLCHPDTRDARILPRGDSSPAPTTI